MKHCLLSFAILDDCVKKKSAANEFKKWKKENEQIIWRWLRLDHMFRTYCKHKAINYERR